MPGEVDTNVASIKEYYRQRTTESQVYLVGVNSVGSMTEGFWKGRIVHGTSLVYGPGGRLLLEGPRGEEAVLLIDIPDEELVTRGVVAVDSTREEGSFPAEDTPRA